MIRIYKSKNNEVKKVRKITKDSWINLIAPSIEEIDDVVKKTGIDKDLILKLRDEEEVPRIEIEDDSTLIVVDCPFIKEGDRSTYYTLPLGIVFNKDYIITVSSKAQEVIKMLKSNKIKSVDTSFKSRFIIQILYYNTRLYLKYLRLIDKKIDESEETLYHSTDNNELIKVLNIEKSLVYFINSLRENYILTEKLSKGNIIPLYEEDLDLLEDAQIENKQGIDMAITYRDILSSVSDTYEAVISNNLNQVMKVLTSLTIIFSVPTMISSFLGMNVPFNDVITSKYSYIIIFVLSILLSIVFALYLKKKRLL